LAKDLLAQQASLHFLKNIESNQKKFKVWTLAELDESASMGKYYIYMRGLSTSPNLLLRPV
jgi:anti-sigma-K factor RskA